MIFSPLPRVHGESASKSPRLLVVVVIDQFRADYLERFREKFGPNGFDRLLRQGAYFNSCFFPYATTSTAPGHASIATGTTPNRHAIANNSWFDRERGRRLAAVLDERSRLVGAGSETPGASPRSLVGSTLADQLRLATKGEAKVFGVAIKDRAAIFSTGRTASGAYWYDYDTGRFITSDYYRKSLPGWVQAYNQSRPAGRYYGRKWERNGQVFVSLTTESGQPDRDFYNQVVFTPYGNDLVLEFARELVKQEELGADEVTDFLFVGFSSNDMVGHRWGPYSEAVADMVLRTDRQMAALLDFLDAQVGKENYWLALSADHGVAPTLAQARERGLEAKNADPRALLEAVERALDTEFGEADWLLENAGITFDRATLEVRGVSVRQAAHVAGRASLAVDGIRGYVAGKETGLDAELTRAVRLSLFPGRAPDVYVLLEPFALWNGDRGGTTHGSPYAYDAHVPLIFYGKAFHSGIYPEKVSPTDLAATLAAALRINPPALLNGNVLSRVLKNE